MPKTLKLREFLKKLRDYGVYEHPNPTKGKGSHIVVIRPESPDTPLKGPQYTLPNHRGKTLGKGIIYACLRRFGIDKNDFLARTDSWTCFQYYVLTPQGSI